MPFNRCVVCICITVCRKTESDLNDSLKKNKTKPQNSDA